MLDFLQVRDNLEEINTSSTYKLFLGLVPAIPSV